MRIIVSFDEIIFNDKNNYICLLIWKQMANFVL